MPALSKIPLPDRIRAGSKVSETGCWEWIKAKRGDYGAICIAGTTWRAHRASYVAFKGEIPDGTVICHSCDNPSCVNPDHLFAATQQQNILESIAKGRKLVSLDKLRQARNSGRTKVFGEQNGQSVLTEPDIRLIRSSSETEEFLATYFRVNNRTIRAIRARKSWRHVA